MKLSKNFKSHLRSQRGQSLVEMSLVMVILLTILSAVLDLGRGFFSYIAIQNAAGEGALYAAINPTCPHASDISIDGSSCGNPNNVDYRTKYESPNGLVDPQKMAIWVTYSDGTDHYSASTISEGQPITVTVSYSLNLIGPFSIAMPNGTLVFQAHAIQNILDLKKN